MKFGKSIKLFLMDGTPTGRWISELSNWTGKAYKIPRDSVSLCSDRKELRSPGVYLLVGKTEDEQDAIYIGESENVFQRICEHVATKDFWAEVIIFISKDDFMNKAHIKYIEHCLYNIAKKSKRYTLINASLPVKSILSEAEIAEAEEFIENIKLITNTLGIKAFEPVYDSYTIQDDDTLSIIIGNISAKGKRTSEGFVVFKGAIVCTNPSKSMPKSLLEKRNKMINEGTITKDYILTEDILFGSPSGASDFICGYSTPGPQVWKRKDGKTLKEYESEKTR